MLKKSTLQTILKMESLLIQTPRTTIRQLELRDLADFHFYRSNPEVTKISELRSDDLGGSKGVYPRQR